MNRRTLFTLLAVVGTAASGLAALPAQAAPAVQAAPPTTHTTRVCPLPQGREASCMAIAVSNADGTIVTSEQPFAAAFTPDDVQAAYNLDGLKSHGRTVAIVDAFGYTTLESDLATYRSTYGLPPCTTDNGCLRIIDQHGGTNLPPEDPGWALEQALDVDAVSAACPDCNIVVVQTQNNRLRSLSRGVRRAAHQDGVVAISNSYGGHDLPRRKLGLKFLHYDQPGIAVTASTGDSGWQGGSYPASDPNVVAVGGTSVTRDGSDRGYSETAWSGAGSGCAKVLKAQQWQREVDTSCGKKRAMSDVSAAANPSLGGLNVYYKGRFIQVGGTSESSPIIGAVYALSGHTEGYPAKLAYDNPKELYDITSGSNGACGAPLCQAGKGWDGPTGLGSPNGIGAF